MKRTLESGQVTRRGFLVGGAATIVTVAVSGVTLLADPARNWAVELPSFTPDQARVLLQFVRDLFPHARLVETFYAEAIAPLHDEAAKDPATRELLASGIAQLNTLAHAPAGKSYADVTDEKARVAAIRQIEGGAFFAKVYGATLTPLYNQRKVWPLFGYEGPSSALGGYLHRGFNDLDWL